MQRVERRSGGDLTGNPPLMERAFRDLTESRKSLWQDAGAREEAHFVRNRVATYFRASASRNRTVPGPLLT